MVRQWVVDTDTGSDGGTDSDAGGGRGGTATGATAARGTKVLLWVVDPEEASPPMCDGGGSRMW